MSSTKRDKELWFALVDCNNFYVSCERVFNPKLIGIPVVVLSNNDGCVIARSKEAKKAGIPMGAPYFEQKELLNKCGGAVCSSNYALYGDLSHRVMVTLSQFTPDLQVYSIDEAFLTVELHNAIEQCRKAKEQVLRDVGIPVSAGIGSTKTLAKIANHLSKENSSQEGVFLLDAPEKYLRDLPVEEIWGIGRQLSLLLQQHGIKTAWQLRNADDAWVRKHMSVVGLRTVWELRGISCLPLEEVPPPKQMIANAKSFGKPVTAWEELAEAIAAYTVRAAEKLRGQGLMAGAITVQIESHRDYTLGNYYNQAGLTLPQATAYSPELVHYAKTLLKGIFRKGMRYRKVGVLLSQLTSANCYQQDLFSRNTKQTAKQKRLMDLLDKTNRDYGKKVLKFAAEGIAQPWKMKQLQRSPRYTTRWEEILSITI